MFRWQRARSQKSLLSEAHGENFFPPLRRKNSVNFQLFFRNKARIRTRSYIAHLSSRSPLIFSKQHHREYERESVRATSQSAGAEEVASVNFLEISICASEKPQRAIKKTEKERERGTRVHETPINFPKFIVNPREYL